MLCAASKSIIGKELQIIDKNEIHKTVLFIISGIALLNLLRERNVTHSTAKDLVETN